MHSVFLEIMSYNHVRYDDANVATDKQSHGIDVIAKHRTTIPNQKLFKVECATEMETADISIL